jgi:aarF domain-containing kinase
MPDGRIAMIDYGQIKTISIEERKILAEIIVAIANNDKEKIISSFKKTGFKSKYGNEYVMGKMAIVTLDQGIAF